MPHTRDTRAPHPADPAYRTFADALSHFVWVTGPGGTLEYLNAAGRAYTGRALDDLMGREWHDVVHPADRPAVMARWAACLATGDRFAAEYRVRRHDGDYRWHSCRGGPYRDPDGRIQGWVGDGIDVHDRRTAEETLALQTSVLEAVATGAPLPAVLDRLAAGVERLADGLLCSVLLLDGDRLRDGAGPSLPAAYRAAIDGVRIGPAVGSCGTAAFRREPVVVTDVATDPLWESYRGLALGHGLRACWSTPVFGRDGQRGPSGTGRNCSGRCSTRSRARCSGRTGRRSTSGATPGAPATAASTPRPRSSGGPTWTRPSTRPRRRTSGRATGG